MGRGRNDYILVVIRITLRHCQGYAGAGAALWSSFNIMHIMTVLHNTGYVCLIVIEGYFGPR